MAKHDPFVSIRQMRDHAIEAIAMVLHRTEDQFRSDRLLELALTRLVEIVGEAARRVPLTFQAKHPEIPWADAIGMRNRLIHGYDKVDKARLWDTVVRDLPKLVRTIDRFFAKNPEPAP